MPEQHIASGARRQERWIVLAAAIAIVAGRSAVFLVWPQAYFDSDQAIVGLMAKHLSELRAFPLFLYGQQYMLGIEAWLAAPLFALAGPSATALKLPLLAINIGIAVYLIRTLERDLGLRPALAGLAALPVILPSVMMAAVFVDASGGSLEPYLWILLLWATRQHPILCGAVLGIGFLNREFTIYGFAALLAIELFDRTLLTRQGALRRVASIAVAGGAFVVVEILKRFASAAGPGTSLEHAFGRANNLAELAARTCLSGETLWAGLRALPAIHWPALLGTGLHPLATFSIESTVTQGFAGSSWLPAAVVGLAIVGIVPVLFRRSAATPPRFAVYLVLVGLFSPAGYVLGRCGVVSLQSMRYELLSLLGIVGLSGWFLSTRPSKGLLAAWSAVFAAWLLVIAAPHVRLATEYIRHRPIPAKERLIDELRAREIRYGKADYWLAYYIDFMTNEQMIFASESPQRILIYNDIVAAHAGEAVRLSRRPCDGGQALIPGVYQCP
jgi:hypothetical protein